MEGLVHNLELRLFLLGGHSYLDFMLCRIRFSSIVHRRSFLTLFRILNFIYSQLLLNQLKCSWVFCVVSVHSSSPPPRCFIRSCIECTSRVEGLYSHSSFQQGRGNSYIHLISSLYLTDLSLFNLLQSAIMMYLLLFTTDYFHRYCFSELAMLSPLSRHRCTSFSSYFRPFSVHFTNTSLSLSNTLPFLFFHLPML